MLNLSGIYPVEYNVLIKQNKTENKTKGGLHLPDENVERMKHAETRGVIVALSPLAFDEAVWPEGQDRPGPGQRVAFARHSGVMIDGKDGEEYRVIKDKDVVALIEAE